jgi:hypothetical protein
MLNNPVKKTYAEIISNENSTLSLLVSNIHFFMFRKKNTKSRKKILLAINLCLMFAI